MSVWHFGFLAPALVWEIAILGGSSFHKDEPIVTD